ncbi:hypothetical protein [Pseudooceanicola sp. MF1-13]|uniref:hypothetical protein n=1 Tax=Pseudooceanicola sp. MF1-13 TaxID=3379095 RepID=UPI0038926E1A
MIHIRRSNDRAKVGAIDAQRVTFKKLSRRCLPSLVGVKRAGSDDVGGLIDRCLALLPAVGLTVQAVLASCLTLNRQRLAAWCRA